MVRASLGHKVAFAASVRPMGRVPHQRRSRRDSLATAALGLAALEPASWRPRKRLGRPVVCRLGRLESPAPSAGPERRRPAGKIFRRHHQMAAVVDGLQQISSETGLAMAKPPGENPRSPRQTCDSRGREVVVLGAKSGRNRPVQGLPQRVPAELHRGHRARSRECVWRAQRARRVAPAH